MALQTEQRLARAVNRLMNNTTSPSICTSCTRTIRRRGYATAAAAATAHSDPTPSASISTSPNNHTSVALPALRPAYQLKAGVLLSRPPMITRDLHPFEKAFYFYQRRLNERLALPFTRYFYYKKGTPADAEWKRKIKERLTPARDIGVYNAYGKQGWNDEVLLGAEETEPENQMQALLRDAQAPAAGGDAAKQGMASAAQDANAKAKEEVERPAGRISEADVEGDLKSLNRLLKRTLFLVVKGSDGRWTFPAAIVVKNENMHTAAERVLVEAAGVNMNTWVVGNHPVGHYTYDFPKVIENQERKTKELGEKVWFMKSRIMAGQANLAANTLGYEDFRWLSKEEVQAIVTPRYWSMCQDMLGDR